MSINAITGFNELSAAAKALFVQVYAKHKSGVEDKESWKAVRVKECRDHIEVFFINGESLEYGPMVGGLTWKI